MKKFSIIISSIFCIVILGYGGYRWIRYEMIDFSTIFVGSLALSYVLNSITWGDHEGANGKDEMDQHIKTQSAKIGYYVLMVLAFLVLFISEGVTQLNDIQNIPLAIVVSLTFVVAPLVEFIYTRRFR